MAFEFKLPDIGEGVAEGEIVRWFVKEGQRVERDQPMVEVLTDKANVEIPAPRAGIILKILAQEGETVPVETTLVLIGEEGEQTRADERAEPGAGAEPAPVAAATRSQTSAKAEAPAARSGRREKAATGPGEPGTQAAKAPAGARAGVREQPKAPGGPVRSVEREEAEARAAASEPAARRAAPAGDGGRRAGPGGAGDGRPRGGPTGAARDVEDARERRPRRISAADRVLAMPGVRRFAREQGVDLALVRGSGSQGHILREDIERFVAEHADRTAAAPAARPSIPAEAEPAAVPRRPFQPLAIRRREAEGPEEELLPYRGVRRQIGKRMAQSVYTAPHYTYVEEVDADALVTLRRDAQALAEERGVKLTYLPFIIKALVPCLRAFPLLNAVLDEEAQQIRLKKRYNIGIATASEEGLIVPVVKNADQLSILEIASEIRRLADAARDRSILIEELKGSTFTITSLGPLGGLLATPIINYPEVAVLGVHAIKQKPVVRDGAIVVGHVMNLSLSFDHRVVDGAVGAEFTRMLVGYLEKPQLLLLES